MTWQSGTDYTPAMVEDALRTMTQAQRRAVHAGRIGRGAVIEGRGYWPLRNALMAKGLMTTANRIPVLTNFGRAVQAALLDEAAE